MVFANRGETISGGNFHGEYPAKVSFLELLLTLKACPNIHESLSHSLSMSNSLRSHGLYPARLLCHRILQPRILGWVADFFTWGSSRPRNQTYISHVSCIGRRVLYH